MPDAERIAAWIGIGMFVSGMFAWMLRTALNEKKWRATVTESCLRNDKRVSELWRFRMRRGYAEALSSGLATPRHGNNRDLFLTDQVRAAFQPIAADLRTMYESLKPIHKDDLMEHIERDYGDWLMQEICVPFKVQDGACLQFAAQVAMENESDWPVG